MFPTSSSTRFVASRFCPLHPRFIFICYIYFINNIIPPDLYNMYVDVNHGMQTYFTLSNCVPNKHFMFSTAYTAFFLQTQIYRSRSIHTIVSLGTRGSRNLPVYRIPKFQLHSMP